jgi:hypothetical protein
MMKSMLTIALEYVRNTGGGATRAHFFEDHEPVGELLWNDLYNRGLATTDSDGRIKPTEEGLAALAESRDL